ncbi:hypothetical protein YC2023_050024 [Brassica napus]
MLRCPDPSCVAAGGHIVGKSASEEDKKKYNRYFLRSYIEDNRKGRLNIVRGEAESGLERLHQCVEKELLQFLNGEGPSKDFNDFRTKLAGLTSVTKNYFENLVKALENGLAGVDSHAACSSKSTGCSSKTRVKGKGSSRTG